MVLILASEGYLMCLLDTLNKNIHASNVELTHEYGTNRKTKYNIRA